MDIHDWWRRTRNENGTLKLSSRRLMVILKNLSEESAFKDAYREDWSEEKYIRVGVLNELRIMRADAAAMHADHKMEPMIIKSPAQLLYDDQDSDHKLAIRGGIMAQLTAPVQE